jgi:hypothetical protein
VVVSTVAEEQQITEDPGQKSLPLSEEQVKELTSEIQVIDMTDPLYQFQNQDFQNYVLVLVHQIFKLFHTNCTTDRSLSPAILVSTMGHVKRTIQT